MTETAVSVPFAAIVTTPSHASPVRPDVNLGPIVAAGLLVALGTIYLGREISAGQALLFLVGVFAGGVLYHAAFGFTSSWRSFITAGRGAGLRAQMLMLALTCAVFFPLLGRGQIFGQAVRGSVSPLGVSVVAGAFLFGIGMQLGGGCASGTLYTAGGGNTRMVLTLIAFIAGSVIGTAHMPWWAATPAARPISLITTFGVWTALAVSGALFASITIVTVVIERRRHGGAIGVLTNGASRWLRGPWPLAAGAVSLALVNIATLVLAGRPWGVTSAFALCGAKALAALGGDVATWPYWSTAAQAASLRAPIATDVTSVMDVGIILGALGAAGLAGRFAPAWRVSPQSAAAAIFGGLLLGYGARIAYGCNIGAYFSGIASGSLHGWLWLVAAFIGNIAGTRLRPVFGLSR
ncbi:MAG: hypothetical protein JWL71_4803 [Acidobacteria bacterium]|nr:hypothetical protein [Acidobacteriota bacterium]